MPVMEATEKLHLFAELLLSLPRNPVHSLHSCNQAICKVSFVYSSKAPLPYDSAEIVSRFLDLRVAESPECG